VLACRLRSTLHGPRVSHQPAQSPRLPQLGQDLHGPASCANWTRASEAKRSMCRAASCSLMDAMCAPASQSLIGMRLAAPPARRRAECWRHQEWLPPQLSRSPQAHQSHQLQGLLLWQKARHLPSACAQRFRRRRRRCKGVQTCRRPSARRVLHLVRAVACCLRAWCCARISHPVPAAAWYTAPALLKPIVCCPLQIHHTLADRRTRQPSRHPVFTAPAHRRVDFRWTSQALSG
jgi:hypothetical protein